MLQNRSLGLPQRNQGETSRVEQVGESRTEQDARQCCKPDAVPPSGAHTPADSRQHAGHQHDGGDLDGHISNQIRPGISWVESQQQVHG
jgi:hypothetical protein